MLKVTTNIAVVGTGFAALGLAGCQSTCADNDSHHHDDDGGQCKVDADCLLECVPSDIDYTTWMATYWEHIKNLKLIEVEERIPKRNCLGTPRDAIVDL